MGNLFSTSLLFCIAFMMIFTYSAEFIIFSEANDPLEDRLLPKTPLDKTYFLNDAYRVSRFYLEGRTFFSSPLVLPKSMSRSYMDYIHLLEHLVNSRTVTLENLYITYLTGVEFYDALPIPIGYLGSGLTKQDIDSTYLTYLHENDYDLSGDGSLTPIQKNLLQQAYDFLKKIPESIGKFFELLTFTIKDKYGINIIPSPVSWVLSMFFIPLQILLFIEILPTLLRIIEAIGALIPF